MRRVADLQLIKKYLKTSLISADAGSARSSCCAAAPCGRGGSWPSRGGTSSIGSGSSGVPGRGYSSGTPASAAAACVRRVLLAAGAIKDFLPREVYGTRESASGWGHKDATRGAAERTIAASWVGEATAAVWACARGRWLALARVPRAKSTISCSSKETQVELRRYSS